VKLKQFKAFAYFKDKNGALGRPKPKTPHHNTHKNVFVAD